MKKILALLAFVPVLAFASSAKIALEKAPINLHDKVSLQRGAQIFVNHCLNCHSATSMRYLRLTDIGLTEAQIRDNLLFTAEKVGEPMGTVLDPKDAKAFFGVVPRTVADGCDFVAFLDDVLGEAGADGRRRRRQFHAPDLSFGINVQGRMRIADIDFRDDALELEEAIRGP